MGMKIIFYGRTKEQKEICKKLLQENMNMSMS